MFTHDTREDVRGRLLAAAERVMARRGVARLRIQEVAKEAGLSQGALYRYFDGKENMLLAVILESVPNVTRLADVPVPGAEGAEEALTSFIAAIYQHEERMAQIALTVLADEALHQRFRTAVAAARGGPEMFPRLVQSTLARYQGAGRIRSDIDTYQVAVTIQARCFHHAVLRRLHGEGADDSVEPLARVIAATLIGRGR